MFGQYSEHLLIFKGIPVIRRSPFYFVIAELQKCRFTALVSMGCGRVRQGGDIVAKTREDRYGSRD